MVHPQAWAFHSQAGDACFCYIGVPQVKMVKVREGFEMVQSLVRDMCSGEVKIAQAH